MQRFFNFSILFTLLILTPLNNSMFAEAEEVTAEKENSVKKKIKLPKDPNAVVVSLDYDGGFAAPSPGHPPVILVRAGGRVEIGQLFGHKKPEIFKIPVTEVKRLLYSIINDNHFFEIDADALKKKNVNWRMAFADAPGVIIIVNANGKKKKIHFDGLAKELHQLAAVEKQLQRLKMVMQVGGKKVVNKWLRVVNKKLMKKYSSAKPLKIENLVSAGKNNNGVSHFTFARSYGWKNGLRSNDYVSRTFAKVTIPSDSTTKAKFDIKFEHSVICREVRE